MHRTGTEQNQSVWVAIGLDAFLFLPLIAQKYGRLSPLDKAGRWLRAFPPARFTGPEETSQIFVIRLTRGKAAF